MPSPANRLLRHLPARAALVGVALVLAGCTSARAATGTTRTAHHVVASSSQPVASSSSTSTSSTSSTSSTTTTSTTGATTTTTTAAPIATGNGKVTVLEIGDSLGIDLGWGMQWALQSDPNVTLIQDAKGDSGLANTGFYDWPAVLEAELKADHPKIVVVFLGANDVQSFYSGGQYVSFGSALWHQAYGSRVSQMMDEATAAGARVLWVGMPIMESPSFSANIATIDSIFSSEASSHAGVTYYSSWPLFATPSGQYNGGTTDVAGSVMPLRDPDGIHLNDGGEDLLGLSVVKELRQLYRLP